MNTENDRRSLILVLEDIEETRNGIEALLKADGYRVAPARDEAEAFDQVRRERPRLLLVCLGGIEPAMIAAARRVREIGGLSEAVPIVIFCSSSVAEGAEVEIGANVYLTRPDDFDQLRALLRRLVPGQPTS